MLKHVNLRMKWWVALCLSLFAMLVVAGPVRAADDGLLSKKELKTLIANAKTPADHQRLAKHFNAKADQLEVEAKDMDEEASYYAAHPTPTVGKVQNLYGQNMQSHCPQVAKKLREAAQEARQIAASHVEMAAAVK